MLTLIQFSHMWLWCFFLRSGGMSFTQRGHTFFLASQLCRWYTRTCSFGSQTNLPEFDRFPAKMTNQLLQGLTRWPSWLQSSSQIKGLRAQGPFATAQTYRCLCTFCGPHFARKRGQNVSLRGRWEMTHSKNRHAEPASASSTAQTIWLLTQAQMDMSTVATTPSRQRTLYQQASQPSCHGTPACTNTSHAKIAPVDASLPEIQLLANRTPLLSFRCNVYPTAE